MDKENDEIELLVDRFDDCIIRSMSVSEFEELEKVQLLCDHQTSVNSCLNIADLSVSESHAENLSSPPSSHTVTTNKKLTFHKSSETPDIPSISIAINSYNECAVKYDHNVQTLVEPTYGQELEYEQCASPYHYSHNQNNTEAIELVCVSRAIISRLSMCVENVKVSALIELATRLSAMSQIVDAHRLRYKREGNARAARYLSSIIHALDAQQQTKVLHCVPELNLAALVSVDPVHSDIYCSISTVLGPKSEEDLCLISCGDLVAQLEMLALDGQMVVDKCFEYYSAHQTDPVHCDSASVTSCSKSVSSRTSRTERSTFSSNIGASNRRPRSPVRIKGVVSQLVASQRALSALLNRLCALLYAPAQAALNKQLNTMLSVDLTLPLVCNALFDGGTPSVAILLLKLQSKAALQSVYSSWPDLTLRIPVFNNSIISAAVPLQLRAPISLTQSKVGSGVSILTFHRPAKEESREDREREHKHAFTRLAGSTVVTAHSPRKLTKSLIMSPTKTPLRVKQSFSQSPGQLSRSHSNLSTTQSPMRRMNDSSADNDDNDSPVRSLFASLCANDTATFPRLSVASLSDGTAQGDVDNSTVTISQKSSLIDVSLADLTVPLSLRTAGFSAQQLFDSQSFSAAQLLSAGYALHQLHAISGLEFSVLDLRAAGYSVSHCAEAGYSLPELYCSGQGYNALELVNSDLFSVEQLRAVGCDPQRYALMCIYEQMGGAQWKNATNWDTCWPLCEWYGVTVNSSNEVVKLKLNGNFLKGHLPSAISLLTSLRHLDMQNNKICGSVPDSVRRLMELKELLLCSNLLVTESRSAIQSMLPTCHIRL